jgi:protein-S-isoprenylcysteine O-methyltransferase Ste14
MRDHACRMRSALGSALFFLVGPGLEAGVGPWLLTGFERREGTALDVAALRALGAVLIAAGLVVLVGSFVRFARDGRGTPAPAAPPVRLVVAGAYRHVRNPMYVATAAVIVGEGLLLAQPILLLAAAVYCTALALWSRHREEPLLLARFGEQYAAYRAAVPGWVPRLRPWTGP